MKNTTLFKIVGIWSLLLIVAVNILEGDLFFLALLTTGVSPYVAAKN